MIFVSLREIFIRTKSFDIEGVIALISDYSFVFLYEKHGVCMLLFGHIRIREETRWRCCRKTFQIVKGKIEQ